MTTDSLKKAWDELSPIQRKVVEWDTGSLLVLAGPGSGKTRILTCRIAHILDLTRDKNFRILALTKLDWNNADFNTRMPVTISVSRKVGEILSESAMQDVNDFPTSYKYYM